MSATIVNSQAGGGDPCPRAVVPQISTISPTVLPYLMSIADGARPLDSMQLSLFRTYCARERKANPIAKNGCLEMHAFLTFMVAPTSNAIGPPQEYDLNYPMSCYFISSSHNTYLRGNQLYGESSTEAYKDVSKIGF